MLVKEFRKITPGFVTQKFRIFGGKAICVSQEFVAGDQVEYEDESGEVVDMDDVKEQYQPYNMESTLSGVAENGLIFTCPNCGEHRLECCEEGDYSSEILCIAEDGDFDYGPIQASGQVHRFQCLDCGYVLIHKEEGFREHPIAENEEVVAWIKENCPQEEPYVGHRGTDDNTDK